MPIQYFDDVLVLSVLRFETDICFMCRY